MRKASREMDAAFALEVLQFLVLRAMNIAGAFGGGMGNMEGTCGALVGSGLVLGLVNKDKAKSMKQMRQIMTKFQERNGATQCKLLKGIGTKVVLRECPDCVADAAEFLEEQLNG